MNNKKLLLIGLFFILLIAIPSIKALSPLDIYLTVDKDSISMSDSSIPILNSDTGQLTSEIMNYTASAVVNPDISNGEYLEHVRNICAKYGYDDVNIHIDSILDDNSLPLFSNVVGTSMEPTLHSGDVIVVNRTQDIQVGDIVTCNDTEFGLIVKRVGDIDGDWIYLESDNKTRTYKLTMGGVVREEGLHKWVTRDRIEGIVVFDLTQNIRF